MSASADGPPDSAPSRARTLAGGTKAPVESALSQRSVLRASVRRTAILTLVALALPCAAYAWTAVAACTAVRSDGIRFSVAEGDLRYEFNALLGIETLVDRGSPTPRRDVATERPADVARLRERMLDRFDAATTEELREPLRGTISSLRGLGYL